MNRCARFANPGVVTQGWYCAGPASRLKGAGPLGVELFGRRLVLFRGEDGLPRALDARCAHLGADLAMGTLDKGRLRCAFHQWTFSGDGRCVACPSAYAGHERARARSWPALERWGALWVWAGRTPLFALPDLPGPAWRLPAQRLRAHPHVVAMNGLDVHHFRAVHGLEFVGEPRLDQPDAYRTRLTLRARVGNGGLLAGFVRALSGGTLEAEFTTVGANLAVIEGRAGKVPVRVLFSHAPHPDGGSVSRTFLIGNVWSRLPAALVMAHILGGDRAVLDRLEFRPGFAPADAALAAFADQAERLPLIDEAVEAADRALSRGSAASEDMGAAGV
ncbi:MAG: Rieske 2Fe-2S domain-containing protein [Elusimicrobia bacterium]|nr:Rieske 2Fe-2S domain-containing protein [Elusimicrobiota bacterium]